MKTMKTCCVQVRLTAMLLVLVMVLTLAACGGNALPGYESGFGATQAGTQDEATEPPQEAYALGMEKLDEATDLTLTNVMHFEIESEGEEDALVDVELDVMLNKPDGKLEMSSVNRFVHVERGENVGLYVEDGDATDAWYRDGLLYLRDRGDEQGVIREKTQEDIFNLYTSGRVILSEDQIISQTIETTGNETLVTQQADPAVVAQNSESLLGSFANLSSGELEFTELTLTMRLNPNGDPVEYGVHTAWEYTRNETHEIWTFDAVTRDISTAPVTIDFPEDLDSFVKEGSEEPEEEAAPAITLSPEEQLALATSIIPPGVTVLEWDEGGYLEEYAADFWADPGMTQDEVVSWYKENLPALGMEYEVCEDTSDAFSVVCSKDGADFVCSIQFDYIWIYFCQDIVDWYRSLLD